MLGGGECAQHIEQNRAREEQQQECDVQTHGPKLNGGNDAPQCPERRVGDGEDAFDQHEHHAGGAPVARERHDKTEDHAPDEHQHEQKQRELKRANEVCHAQSLTEDRTHYRTDVGAGRKIVRCLALVEETLLGGRGFVVDANLDVRRRE